jgi:hypothetical protein
VANRDEMAEVQLNRVSGVGGAAFISCAIGTNATGPVGVGCREVWIQASSLTTARVFVNFYAEAAVTAGVAVPIAVLSAAGQNDSLNAAIASLSAINCYCSAVAGVNVLWRR